MRLRVAGQPPKDNVTELMKTVPPITQAGHHPEFALDRGYIEEKLIADPAVALFKSVGICNDASCNPYVAEERVKDQKKKYSNKTQEPADLEDPDNERTIFDSNLMEKCTEVFEDWIINFTN